MSEEKESKSADGPLAKILNSNPKPLRQPNSSGEVSVASSGEEKESKSAEGPLAKMMNSKPKPLRQPNSSEEVSMASSGDKPENEPEDVEQKNVINKLDGKVLTSTLNVNAAEFIPYSQKTQNEASFENIHMYLTEMLQCLAVTPGKYDEILEDMYDLLSPFHEDEEFMKSVTNTVVDECITQPNLYYNGARLCTDLQKMFGPSFRKFLLQSCQENDLKATNPSMLLERGCGFGLFLAEVYLQMDIQGKRITVLGDALFDLLQVLLNSKGDKATKCVCQILKLTGVMLEENRESSKAQMDEIFSRLRAISVLPDLDPNLRLTINNVIQMRDSNWGRNKTQQSSSVGAVNANGYDDIVFFGPDGVVITDEEKSFLLDNLPSSDDVDDCLCDEDSMDEEMFNDYEEFLKLNEQAAESKK